MRKHQTYRVTVLTSQLHAIDIAAPDESAAITRAEKLWHSGQTQNFDCVHHKRPEVFGIDEDASLHLADDANEDRAQWAANALAVFARETGTELGPEALHDLLCDLGHYADDLKLDYREEMKRAAETWAEEKSQ
jgi:hypothetical protein